MSGGRVTDRDQGYADLVKRVFELQRPKVSVGIFEADGQADAGNGVRIIDIAVWNEFGTETIPARSFIRAWFDENLPRAKETLSSLLVQVVAGKLSKEAALDRFGLWLQAEIQARIARGIPPPNAPSTVAKKGSSKPLIDTGQLRSSVSFAVDLGSGDIKVHPSGARGAAKAPKKPRARRR